MRPTIGFCGNVLELQDIIGGNGMAKDRKTLLTPAQEIAAPNAIIPLMQAFHVDSDKVAKALISEAATAVYGQEKVYGAARAISKSELNSLVSLMRCIKPRDSLETLYAAQIVVSHMLGMRKLAEICSDDQKLGLNLLRFSNEAMQMLVKKQSGSTQNVVVNYSYSGHGNALMQTVIPEQRT